MAVLICGGAGYIGSHAVRALREQGREVVVLDSLRTGHRQSLPADVPFVEGDMRDPAVLDAIFARHTVESVLHFAASSLVGESMQLPLQYFSNNVHGMQVLLEAMVRHGVERIVFSSSAAVYGEPDSVPITEEAPLRPGNPYGESKRIMESMMRWAAAAHGLRYVSLRYFNVGGAAADGSIGEDHRPESHLIPLILQVPLGRRPHITIFGDDYDTPDGTCIRDYVGVEDLIEAHTLALRHLEAGGQSDVFNLGSEQGFSVRQMIETARRVTGRPLPVVVGARRPGDPARLVASSRKAGDVLGWQPRQGVDEIIASAWRWHSRHPAGYKK
ncbi:UDP-glucose 4-epimerase GalE [uncultured Desulfovibrio sp.]|uniref:UDP-glucose 4-epimerase GalE n=1 Tax=uncultured Desulfovibrio sp. TaxID=167968 RepID=UPI00260719E7|nr:UDP-glucose 4-epimerase GalE [uncultured Desulfovibrio sp.]